MTKNVLIENADCSDYKVKCTVQDRDVDGNWKDDHIVYLDCPTASTKTAIWKGRRIVIEEDGTCDWHWTQKEKK